MPNQPLKDQHCEKLPAGSPAISSSQAADLLKQIHGWGLKENQIQKSFSFKDFYKTMAFVNAVAWIANSQDHHPDMEVSYDKCTVKYSTHSVGGLSRNDFISAAKVDALFT